MPIPSFTIDGVLPPFVGADGPGGAFEDLSPYVATATDVITRLGTTATRRTLLRNFLGHRAALRAVGFDRGFQWLDGSFVEDKDPQDLDIVAFLFRPPGIRDGSSLARLLQANAGLFTRAQVKAAYRLDFYPVDLNGTPETLVNLTRYWLGLFSHRRPDHLWKGILQVRLDNETDDAAALAILDAIPDATFGEGRPFMSLRKLERDFLHADAAAVANLVQHLDEEDVMTRFGLESRLASLREEIERLDATPHGHTASAALFFGGRPVVGQYGIESAFAGNAISKFQDVVAKVLARESGPLGQRGVVAHKSGSTLHITNVVRGSFGFLLEEANPQGYLLDSSLRIAVDEASRLLNAFREPDEEQFRTAVESIDDRLLSTAREFFAIMRSSGATFRLVTDDTDRSFGIDSIDRAADRATTTTVHDNDETLVGQLAGTLPDGHQFEFRAPEPRGTIRGRVDRALSAELLARYNLDWVNVDAVARVRVRRILRNDEVVRESFTLLGIDTHG